MTTLGSMTITAAALEGAGLDGVMAKRLDAPYLPGEPAMVKVKHPRTADCVVAGFRWHENGVGTMVGSLLLGLHDDARTLHHVGVTAAFTHAERRRLGAELAPLREGPLEGHPGRDWAEAHAETDLPGQRMPGATGRWNRGKDLAWEPLRQERVCEVAYSYMEGARFRHAAQFVCCRPTSDRKSVAMTSWRSPRLTSPTGSSARARRGRWTPPLVRGVVGLPGLGPFSRSPAPCTRFFTAAFTER
jgi:ATP-dependent DNA ligase